MQNAEVVEQACECRSWAIWQQQYDTQRLKLAGGLHIFVWIDFSHGVHLVQSVSCDSYSIVCIHLWEESVQLVYLSSVRSVSLLAGPQPSWLGFNVALV